MSRRRRFFIFFASAGLMSAFIFFSLSVREDRPLDKWLQWLPENKIKAMILDQPLADGKMIPRAFEYTASADSAIAENGITRMEVRHYLRAGDVVLSHEKSLPRNTPKQYYIEEEINHKRFFVVIEVHRNYSLVTEFGILQESN